MAAASRERLPAGPGEAAVRGVEVAKDSEELLEELKSQLLHERSALQNLKSCADAFESERDELARSLQEEMAERMLLQEEVKSSGQRLDAAEAKAQAAAQEVSNLRDLLKAKEDELRSIKKVRRASPKDTGRSSSGGICQACGMSLKPPSSPGGKTRSPRLGEANRLAVAPADAADTTDDDPGTARGSTAPTAEGGSNMERLLAQLREAESLAAREALCARDAALFHSAEVERRCMQLRDTFAGALEGLARLQAQELLEAAGRLAGRARGLGCGAGAAPGELQPVESLERQLRDVEARLEQAVARLKGSLAAAGARGAGAKQDAKIVAQIMDVQQEVSALQCERIRVDALLLVAKLREAQATADAQADTTDCQGQTSKELVALRGLLERTRELCSEATAKLLAAAEENVKLTSTLSKVQGSLSSRAAGEAASAPDPAAGEERQSRPLASGVLEMPQGEAQRQQLLQEMSRAVIELDTFLSEEAQATAEPFALPLRGGPSIPGPSCSAPELHGGAVTPLAAKAQQLEWRGPCLESVAPPPRSAPEEVAGGDERKPRTPRRNIFSSEEFHPPMVRPYTSGVAATLPRSPPDGAPKTARGLGGNRASNLQKLVLPALKPRSAMPAFEAGPAPEISPAMPQPPLEPPRAVQREVSRHSVSTSVNVD